MIKDVERKAYSDLSLATTNSKLIAGNTERISSQQFDYWSLGERRKTLETKKKELTDELEGYLKISNSAEGKLGLNKTNPSQSNYECYTRIRQGFYHQ